MAEPYKNERLKGLRSWSELSQEERDDFKKRMIDGNPDKIDDYNSLSNAQWSVGYDTYNFKQVYGKEALDEIQDYNQRNSLYRHAVINNAIDEEFKDSPIKIADQLKANGVTDDALIDILESGKFSKESFNNRVDRKSQEYLSNDPAFQNTVMTPEMIDRYKSSYTNRAKDDILAAQQKELDEIISKDNKKKVEWAKEKGIVAENEKAVDALYNTDQKAFNELFNDIVDGYYIDEDGTKLYTEERLKPEKQKIVDQNNATIKDLREQLESVSTLDDSRGAQQMIINQIGKLEKQNRDIEALNSNKETKFFKKVSDGAYVEDYSDYRQKTDAELRAEFGDDYNISDLKQEDLLVKKQRFKMPGSPYYRAFKDDELAGFTDDDKKKVVSEYLTLRGISGEVAARNYTSDEFQSMVAHSQNWFSNWGATTGMLIASNTLNVISPFVAQAKAIGAAGTIVTDEDGNQRELTYSEALANINQGLNPDGTPMEEWDFWNPRNIEDMEKFGTLSPEYVEWARANNGVSKNQHVYNPEDGDKLTWEQFFFESTKMIGFTASQLAVNYALSGAGAALGAVGRGLSAAGKLGRAVGFIPKALGAVAGSPYFAAWVNSVPIAQAYSMGTFENVMEKGTAALDARKDQDAANYAREYAETNPEAFQKAVEEWKQENAPKLKNTGDKNKWVEGTIYPNDEWQQIAEKAVLSRLSEFYKNNKNLWNGVDYDEMERQLGNSAILAYNTNLIIESAANTAASIQFGKWKMTDAQRRAIEEGRFSTTFDNIAKNPKIDYTSAAYADKSMFYQLRHLPEHNWLHTWFGGAANEKNLLRSAFIGSAAKNAYGGFQSNYLDDIRAAYAQSIGLDRFNDYLDYAYGIDNYKDGLHTVGGYSYNPIDFIGAGTEGAANALGEMQSWRDGIIGFGGSVFSIGLGITPRAVENAVRKRGFLLDASGNTIKDANGKPVKMSFLDKFTHDEMGMPMDIWEIASNFVHLMPLEEYHAAKSKLRRTKSYLNEQNKLYEEYEDVLGNVGEALHNAERLDNLVRQGRDDGANTDETGGILSPKGAVLDAKTLTLFSTLRQIEKWKNDPTMMESEVIQKAINDFESYYTDQVSDEEVEKYIYQNRQNLAKLGLNTWEERETYARKEIAEQQRTLKDSAERFYNIKDNLTTIMQRRRIPIDDSAEKFINQMAYNLMQQQDWMERIQSMRNELGIGETAVKNNGWVGTRENHALLQSQYNDAHKRYEDKLKALDIVVKANKKKASKLSRKDRKLMAFDQRKSKNQLAFSKWKLNDLVSDFGELAGEYEEKLLSKEDIMALPAKQRAYMLDPDNLSSYSQHQQNIINSLIEEKASQDPNFLEKINDLAVLEERMKLNVYSYNLGLRDPEAFLSYIEMGKDAFKAKKPYALAQIRQDAINTSIRDIQDGQIDGAELTGRMKMWNMSSKEVNDYLDNFENSLTDTQKNTLKEYSKALEYAEGIANEINDNTSLSTALKDMLNSYVAAAVDNANTLDELKANLSDLASDDFGEYSQIFKDAIYNQDKIESQKAATVTEDNVHTVKSEEKVDETLEELDKTEPPVVKRTPTKKAEEKIEAEKKVISEKESEIDEALRKEQEAEDEAEDLEKTRQHLIKRASEKSHKNNERREVNSLTFEEQKQMALSVKDVIKDLYSRITKGKTLRKTLANLETNTDSDNAQILRDIAEFKALHDYWGKLAGKKYIAQVTEIENALKNLGYEVTDIEDTAIDSFDDVVIYETEYDPTIYKGVTIAVDSKPIIRKNGKLIFNGEAKALIGTREVPSDITSIEEEALSDIQDIHQHKKDNRSALQRRFDALEEPVTGEEFAWYSVASGKIKFRWTTKDGDKGLSKGISSLYTSTRNGYITEGKAEKRVKQSLIDDENGYTVSEFGEYLYQEAPGLFKDEQDAVDIAEQVILDASTRLAAIEEVENIQAERREDVERAAGIAPFFEEATEESPVEETTETSETTEQETQEEPSTQETVEDNQVPTQSPLMQEQPTIVEKEEQSLVEQELERNPDSDVEVIDVSQADEFAFEEDYAGEAEATSDYMFGNAMYEYDKDALRTPSRMKTRRPHKKGDSIWHFFNWADSRGLKLQNIMDHELHKFIKAKPNLKVYPMKLNLRFDGQKLDKSLIGHTFLVIDYDADIAKLHNAENGGVMKFNGKEYLIVGVYGYANQAQATNYMNVGKTVYNNAMNYFNHNGDECYVHTAYHTEIKSISNGLIARTNQDNLSPRVRRISEILADKNSNPLGWTFRDLGLGIQKMLQLIPFNSKGRKVLPLRNTVNKSGSNYILIESSSGAMVPVYINPILTTDIPNGTKLKDALNSLFRRLVTSRNVKDARDIKKELERYVAFGSRDNTGNDLIITEDGKVILRKNNVDINTMYLTGENADTFLESLMETAYRVNIPSDVFNDAEVFEMMDEAGALTCDIGELTTSHAIVKVYPIDPVTGNPIITETNTFDRPIKSIGGTFNADAMAIADVFVDNARYRRLKDKPDVWVDSFDRPITDEALIEKCEMVEWTQEHSPNYINPTNKVEYYVMDEVNKKAFTLEPVTKKVRVCSDVAYSKLEARLEEIRRQKNAEQMVQELPTNPVIVDNQATAPAEETSSSPQIENEAKPATPATEKTQQPTKKQPLKSEKSGTFALSEILENPDNPHHSTVYSAILDKLIAHNKADLIDKPISETIKYIESILPITNITNVEDFLNNLNNCK